MRTIKKDLYFKGVYLFKRETNNDKMAEARLEVNTLFLSSMYLLKACSVSACYKMHDCSIILVSSSPIKG